MCVCRQVLCIVWVCNESLEELPQLKAPRELWTQLKRSNFSLENLEVGRFEEEFHSDSQVQCFFPRWRPRATVSDESQEDKVNIFNINDTGSDGAMENRMDLELHKSFHVARHGFSIVFSIPVGSAWQIRMLPCCAWIFQAEVQVSVAFCCEPSAKRNSGGFEFEVVIFSDIIQIQNPFELPNWSHFRVIFVSFSCASSSFFRGTKRLDHPLTSGSGQQHHWSQIPNCCTASLVLVIKKTWKMTMF